MPKSKTVTVDAQLLGQTIAQVAAEGGSFVLTITGNSMRPWLKPGVDRVRLVKAGTVREGDVVFFRRLTGEYVLHRVIRVDGETLTVNGDSQDWTERITREQVLAVTEAFYHGNRWYDADSLRHRLLAALWPATRKLRPTLIHLKQKLK